MIDCSPSVAKQSSTKLASYSRGLPPISQSGNPHHMAKFTYSFFDLEWNFWTGPSILAGAAQTLCCRGSWNWKWCSFHQLSACRLDCKCRGQGWIFCHEWCRRSGFYLGTTRLPSSYYQYTLKSHLIRVHGVFTLTQTRGESRRLVVSMPMGVVTLSEPCLKFE